MYSNKKLGRLAGLIFLILAITGIFAEFFVRQKLYVPGDLAATYTNITENQWLFRLGFVSDLLMSTSFFFYVFVMYTVFKKVNKNLSLLMLLLTVISVAMFCQNALNQFAGLKLLTTDYYVGALNYEQLQSLATFFTNIHMDGYLVNQIFYGLYMFPLGYMIFKSGLAPKVIGVFLMLGAIVDIIDFIVYFLYPNINSVFLQNITIPADIGEISLCLWLLFMGLKNYDAIENV
ncbi:DUF4386 domain-containing protein [uncultured Maribacter sp.]|uniref:DUF4386 domain-containing protein n=1 Tax=uncultured Maribacter sp. TaxID=431308 RepID=UPI00262498E1|nr:DUF4386 domain-containing protein [uncultured Maribacter sp.]